MNTKICAVSLSLLVGACALAMPAVSHAGTVGYFRADGGLCSGNPSAAIVAAGHTPVAIATLDSTSLAPLNGLVIESICGYPYTPTQAVNDAVANGMALYIDVTDISASQLPGSPAVNFVVDCTTTTSNANLVPGTPIINGPGGTLTDASLDGAFYCSGYSFVDAPLPAGLMPLLTGPSANKIFAFSYMFGNGKIVVSSSQQSGSLPGGSVAGYFPGTSTLYTNVIAWLMSNTSTTTCASEGYKGAQLTWCKNICENGLTGQVLDTWIHRWINRYRQLPYCAVEGGGEGGEGGRG